MSIGASGHRAFVRAKARFAGPKGSGTHFVHRNAVIPDILPCIVGGFFWRKVPRVPCPSRRPSVRPARSHSLPVAPARPSAAFTSARHEPIPANRLQPGSPTCPAWPSATSAAARCEPFSAFPLLPGSSTCPAWPSAASVAAGYEPFPENRLTPVSRDSGFWPGTMAAGAREQTASCDAFVLSRRLPAPDAPPIRKSPAYLVAKPFPEPSPNHGPVSGRAGTATVEHPPARGTSRCAPGAFSLTAMIFRSSRA